MKMPTEFIENMSIVDNILRNSSYVTEEGPYVYNAKLIAKHIKDNYSKKDIKTMIDSGGLKNLIRKISNDSKILPTKFAPMDPKSILARNKSYWVSASANEVYQILRDYVGDTDKLIKTGKVKKTVTQADMKKWDKEKEKRKETIAAAVGKFRDGTKSLRPAYTGESFTDEELDFYTDVLTEAFNMYIEEDSGINGIRRRIHNINNILYENGTAENILQHKIKDAENKGNEEDKKKFEKKLSDMVKNREFIKNKLHTITNKEKERINDANAEIKKDSKSLKNVDKKLSKINDENSRSGAAGKFNTIKNLAAKRKLDKERKALSENIKSNTGKIAFSKETLSKTIGKTNATNMINGVKSHHTDYGYLHDSGIHDEHTSKEHQKIAKVSEEPAKNKDNPDGTRGWIAGNMIANRKAKEELVDATRSSDDLANKIDKTTKYMIRYRNDKDNKESEKKGMKKDA